MENAASAVLEQHTTSQKSKKKSKNKKQNGKGSVNNGSHPAADNATDKTVVSTSEGHAKVAAAFVAENGLCEKLEQQLHIVSDGHQTNGIAKNGTHAHDVPTHAHATQNGHHIPASAPNGTCLEQTMGGDEAGGKKTKSNKLKNKETDPCCNHANINEITMSDVQLEKVRTSTKTASGRTAQVVKAPTTKRANKHLENGFSSDDSVEGAAGSGPTENDKSQIQDENDLQMEPNNCAKRTRSTETIAAKLSSKPSQEGQNEAAKEATTCSAQVTTNSFTAKPNAAAATAAAASQTRVETTETQSSQISPEPALDLSNVHIEYKEYESELQMHDIMRLIQAELSEPYSIYTYRYFIYNWPNLCFLAAHGNEYVGAIVCKLDMHMNMKRGYIAMLAVRKEYRKLKIGTTLVQKAIEAMLADNADEVVLETEMRNVPALRLYENLGFVRDKRLFRYYLNGVDALRLKLWFR